MSGLRSVPPRTLRKVVAYLEDELGLSVYGPCINVETGEQFAANMDFSVDDIIAFRKLLMRGGEIWQKEE